MPIDGAPSPVVPASSSRLWSHGAVAGLAVLTLLVSAVVYPVAAPGLVIGAVAVIAFAVLLARPRVAASDPVVPNGPERPPRIAGGLLDRALDDLPDPLLIVSGGEADDIAGRRIVMANTAACDLLRVPREGGLLLSAIRDPGVLEAIDEALFGGVERVIDYAAGGARTRHWQAWVKPLAVEGALDGQPLALMGFRDETDARRMALMRVDFLANASHELRTPLASLTGFIETLKGHARDDAVARDRFLDIMAIQAERMGRLVADLLSLSRIELNEHIPPDGRVDVARACLDVLDAVSVLTKARSVSIDLDTGPGTTVVDGDRDEIVQVIQNLVDNAIKYSPSGGRIEMAVRSDLTLDAMAEGRMAGATRLPLVAPDREAGARYVEVSVRDHGPGLAREHLPRLTERFYRVEGQKSGERSGTGLGLAIVKHILNRHRGGLTVQSAPGHGALFTVFLPLAQTRAQPPSL